MAQPSSPLPILEARGLTVRFGERTLLRDIALTVPERAILGVVGPSGAGKSTLLRCLNRMVDLHPELRVEGEVLLHGGSIYDPGVDPDEVRARIGMIFQQPVVFPRSIWENVLFGVRRLGRVPRRHWGRAAERALTEAALWDEVKDRLREPATQLSVGQQQRLCLARALAVEPEVLLMDEPTSALDPTATAAIERLMTRLKAHRALVLVTHDVEQARRVSDRLVAVKRRDGAGEVTDVEDWAAVYA